MPLDSKSMFSRSLLLLLMISCMTGCAELNAPWGGLGFFLTNTEQRGPSLQTGAIEISGVTGNTTEAGGTATFTVVLTSRPASNVSSALASSDIGEGSVSPAALTFTPDNWNAPQTVTITGVDDSIADGDIVYSIVTAPSVSADGNFHNIDPADVTLTNTDVGETAGITIGAVSGPVTEIGGTATFTVVLNSEPTADVTLGLSSTDTGEGTVSPATVTFTSTNWNAPQTVTITGVDDALIDGNQTYTILTAAAVSADGNYNGLNPADVTATTVDNDGSVGVTVSAVSGATSESGATATFTIQLNSAPTSNVAIALSSSDTGEGTVSPAALTFTPANYASPQTVTVTGVDDGLVDGNQPYFINTAAAVSADAAYNGLDPANVPVVNNDDETPGVTVSGITSNTSEAGTSGTFTIVLNSQPTANVVIGITSSDTGEGTVSPSSLTFTSANWNAPQTVTVTGQDDALIDGNQPYKIITSNAVSADGNYNGMNVPDVGLTNTDNDSPGISVSAAGGDTTEGGGGSTFTIVLNSAPTGNVTIPLSSSDTGEGTVSPATLVFTPVNWASPQVVTVTGVDDALQDGNQVYNIITGTAVSSDGDYNGLDPDNVMIVNRDDDSPGIHVTPTAGLTTTEAGGQAMFNVSLNSQPVGDVTITLTSSDTTEGTVSPASITFTTTNWAAPQTVTVTGVDDGTRDGNQYYTIATAAAVSADAAYNGLNPADVTIQNTDNETEGFTITTDTLQTTENGGQATFTVVLNAPPPSNVTVPVFSSDTSEGTVSPSSLVFTPTNWNAPQTVTVTGVDDGLQDGNVNYQIVIDEAVGGGNYDEMIPRNVNIVNIDNDSPGFDFNIDPVNDRLVTTEAGGQASFTINLTTAPGSNVVVNLAVSDSSEGTLSSGSLTFTPANWNVPQTVFVTGVDDGMADGDIDLSIITTVTTADGNYLGLNPEDVNLRNQDDDTPGFSITPITSGNRLITTEAGGQATFTVVLFTAPVNDVTIALSSSDASEGALDKTTLVFTPANWNAPQTVTITGVDDALDDNDRNYQINFASSTSTDPAYNGLSPGAVLVTNLDDDPTPP